MDTYVKVGSDLQLAVRYIMLSKKAFLQQSRCVKELNKQNDLLQQKVKELEMNNKELRALSLLVKQNQTLKERVLGLTTTSSRKKRERVLDDILKCDDNTFSVSEDYTIQPNNNVTSSDINSTGDEEDMRHCPQSCPKSPIKKKKISPNKFETPSKKNPRSTIMMWKEIRLSKISIVTALPPREDNSHSTPAHQPVPVSKTINHAGPSG